MANAIVKGVSKRYRVYSFSGFESRAFGGFYYEVTHTTNHHLHAHSRAHTHAHARARRATEIQADK